MSLFLRVGEQKKDSQEPENPESLNQAKKVTP